MRGRIARPTHTAPVPHSYRPCPAANTSPTVVAPSRMVCDHVCTALCLGILFYVERNMALNLSGLHTGRYHRLYVLKYGEYIDVPTLGGGGDDTTGLATRLATVETALTLKAEQSTVDDQSGIVTLKAEQTALDALSASSLNNQANSVLASASGVLQHLVTQLPLKMTTDRTANLVQLRLGDVSQLASPRDLRPDHAHG